jgi:hypothetical protein
MVNLQIVLLSAPTSLSSITMVVGPHAAHAAVTHVGDSSEVGQREHMVRLVFTESAGLSFCVLVTISPRRAKQVGGFVPRDVFGRQGPLRRTPPLAPRRRARGRSPIGYFHMLNMWDGPSHQVSGYIAG